MEDVLDFSNFELIGNNVVIIPISQVSISGTSTLVTVTSQDILNADISNGNEFFDLNEILTFNFDMNMDEACPMNNAITINHATYWGLKDITSLSNYCDKTESTKSISFSNDAPDLSISSTINTSLDGCIGYNSNALEHTFNLINNGEGTLENLSFSVIGYYNNLVAFDADQILYQINGDPSALITPDDVEEIRDTYSCFGTIPSDKNLKTVADLSVPVSLSPGDTLKLFVQSYACCPTSCVHNYRSHDLRLVSINYEDACDNIFSENTFNSNVSKFNWTSSLVSPSNFFENSSTQYAFIDIFNGDFADFIMADNALFELEVILPGGIDLGNTGTANEIQWVGGETNPGNAIFSELTDDRFTIQWDMTSENYEGGVIQFPMDLDCSENIDGNPLIVNLYVIPKVGCASGDCKIPVVCESINISTGCPGICTDGGVNHIYYDFYRFNIDEADADNNGCPDTDNDCDGILSSLDTDEIAAPAFDTTSIRRYRALEGDTLISDVLSVVKIGDAGEFRRIKILDDFGSNAERNKFVPFGADVSYTDQSEGITYTQNISASWVTGGFEIRIKPSEFGLNNGTHRFSDNDTIQAKIYYGLRNYSTTATINRSVQNIVYGLTANNFNNSPKYSCSDYAGNITQISIDYNRKNAGNVTIKACDVNDIAVDLNLLVGKTTNTQFFPNEYRNIGFLDSFALRVIDTYEFIDAGIAIESIYNLDGDTIPVLPTEIIVGTGYTDYIFDLEDPLNNSLLSHNGGPIFPGDESYVIKIIANASPTCNVTNNIYEDFDPENVASFARFQKHHYLNSNTYTLKDISRITKAQIADLEMSSLDQIEPFSNNQMLWSLNIQNKDNNQDADFVWLYVESLGSIDQSSISLIEDNNGTLTTLALNANGFYELGEIQKKKSVSYLIQADVFNCQKDSLTVYTGHRCDEYPSSTADAKEECFEEFTVYVQPENARVSSIITPLASSPDPSDGNTLYGSSEITMCEPFPVEIKIVSGQLEPIDDVILSVPPIGNGIEYVANSGYIWYDRNGDGNLEAFGEDGIDDLGSNDDERIPFDTTFDQQLVNTNGTGNNFIFNIQALTQGSGLFDWLTGNQNIPGVKNIPQNIVYVRYEMQTTCDVVIGTPITAQVFANRALCGGPARGNGELRSGFNMKIAGAVTPYSTTNNTITLNDINSCGDTNGVNFTFTKKGNSPISAKDSVVVFLPSGVEFESFSSNSGDQNIDPIPSISSSAIGQFLKWPVPQSLANNETIDFEILVKNTTMSCNTFEIRMEVQTVISIECRDIICSETKINAGSAIADLEIELPTFSIIVEQLDFVSGTLYEGEIEILNSSNIDHENDLTIELYKYDGTGLITGSPLHTITIDELDANATENINFSFNSTEDIASGVIAILPNLNDNCFCSMPDPSDRNFENYPYSFKTPNLPVELISFSGTVENCKVKLTWETALEENFSHYEILKFTPNNGPLHLIKRIEGEFPLGGYYEFIDHDIYNTRSVYYQLKMVDLDGSYELSKLLTLDLDCESSSIQVFPNPIKSSHDLQIEFDHLSDEVIFIIDINGRILKEIILDHDALNIGKISIPITGFSPGIYMVKTANNISTKFIVTH